ncbi:DNA directed RNA polymerase [Xylariaceae sp. FL0016]|nr:DNA directed RNA polymerase [Xylariaceae sp. FL0016]
MSREAYQIPTAQGSSSSGGGAGAAGGQPQRSAFDANPTDGVSIQYICGDCGFTSSLRRVDAIRCKECGCRILYKSRTKRMVQFEAR